MAREMSGRERDRLVSEGDKDCLQQQTFRPVREVTVCPLELLKSSQIFNSLRLLAQ